MPRTVVIRSHDAFFHEPSGVRFVKALVSVPGSKFAREYLGIARDVPDEIVAAHFAADPGKWYLVPIEAPIAPTVPPALAPVAAPAAVPAPAAGKAKK